MARGRTGSRGTKEWGGGPFGQAVLTTTQAILASFTDVDPSTILRIRGNIFVKGTPDAASDQDVVGLGICIISDEAAAVGGASVPGPIASESYPWIWHQYVPLQAGQATLLGQDIGSMRNVEIDSKAMRKLGIGQTFVLVGELFTGTFAEVRVNGGFRVLVMHG